MNSSHPNFDRHLDAHALTPSIAEQVWTSKAVEENFIEMEKKIVIKPELMSYSNQLHVITQLKARKGESRYFSKSILQQLAKILHLKKAKKFEDTAITLIANVYKIKSKFARSYTYTIDGKSRSPYKNLGTFYNAMEWRKPYVLMILDDFLLYDNASNLQGLLESVILSAELCKTGKLNAFNSMLMRWGIDHESSDGFYQGGKQKLFNELLQLIEEMKGKAMKSTFLEPCRFYFRISNSSEYDVYPHGIHTFGAIVLATLGIRTSQPLVLDDGILGVVHFHKMLSEVQLHVLWSKDNFGRNFEAMHSLKKRSKIDL